MSARNPHRGCNLDSVAEGVLGTWVRRVDLAGHYSRPRDADGSDAKRRHARTVSAMIMSVVPAMCWRGRRLHRSTAGWECPNCGSIHPTQECRYQAQHCPPPPRSRRASVCRADLCRFDFHRSGGELLREHLRRSHGGVTLADFCSAALVAFYSTLDIRVHSEMGQLAVPHHSALSKTFQCK